MENLLKKKLKINQKNLVLDLLIVALVFVCIFFLFSQSRYEPNNRILKLDSSRSQVYFAGKGYKVDKKQLKEHEKIEKLREDLIKKKPLKHLHISSNNNIGKTKNTASKTQKSKDKLSGEIDLPDKNKPNENSGNKKQDAKAPSIKTSIKDGMVVNGSKLVFTVHAWDYTGEPIDAINIKVRNRGTRITSTGRNGTGFNYLAKLQKGENLITVRVVDEKGKSAFLERTVWCRSLVQKRTDSATVKISAETIGISNIVTKEMKIYPKEPISSVITRCMKDSGITWDNKGTVDRGFYLSRIYKPGIAAGRTIHPRILEHYKKKPKKNGDGDKDEGDSYPWISTEHQNDSLGEFDFTNSSGWVGYLDGKSIDQGFSAIGMSDGSTIWIRFTLTKGEDLKLGDRNGWWK